MPKPQFAFEPDALAVAFASADPYASSKANEQANIATIQRVLNALSMGDLEALVQELDPDMELDILCPDYFPWIRQAKGVEAIVAAVRQNFGCLEDQTPTIHSLNAQGDRVDISAEETGRIRDTGQTYSISGLLQYELRDGKVISLREIVSDRATSSNA